MQETQETQIRSLGWEDPLEEEMAIHSSILVRKNPWMQSMCVLSTHTTSFQILGVLCLVAQSCPILCDPMYCSLQGSEEPLSPWSFPGKSTGGGCHFLLQGIFPTEGSSPGLPHCRQTLATREAKRGVQMNLFTKRK